MEIICFLDAHSGIRCCKLQIYAGTFSDWPNEFAWLKMQKDKSLRVTVLRIAWCATKYHFWMERNCGIHGEAGSGCGSIHYSVVSLMLWDTG